MRVESIAVKKIWVDVKANRPPTEIEDLAASLQKHGLLQPIGVALVAAGDGAPKSFTHRLLFGQRRLAAAESLDWKEIECRILGGAADVAVRVIENADRVPPTFQQEIEAVRRVQTKLGEQATVADVAAELGKQPLWVAQRLALTRVVDDWWKLAGEVHLTRPLLYALARLGPEQQREHLPEKWDVTDGSFSAKLVVEDIERQAKKERKSLVAVAWDLSDKVLVAAAGACDGCEFRGDRPLPLFPDAHVDAKPSCTNGACFETKTVAALRQKAAATEKELGIKPKILLTDYHTGPFDENEIVHSCAVAQAKPDTKGAVPVLAIEGKQAGKIQWVKPTPTAGYGAKAEKSRGDAPPPEPKSDAVRLRTLKRRRLALAVRKYCEQLPKLPCRLDAAVAFVLAFGTNYRHEFGRDQKYDVHQDGEPHSLAEAVKVKEADWHKRLFAAVAGTIVKRLRIDRVEDDAEKCWLHAEEIAVAAGHHNDLVACLTEANAEIKTPKSLAKAAAKVEAETIAATTPKKRGRPPKAESDRKKAASGERA